MAHGRPVTGPAHGMHHVLAGPTHDVLARLSVLGVMTRFVLNGPLVPLYTVVQSYAASVFMLTKLTVTACPGGGVTTAK